MAVKKKKTVLKKLGLYGLGSLAILALISLPLIFGKSNSSAIKKGNAFSSYQYQFKNGNVLSQFVTKDGQPQVKIGDDVVMEINREGSSSNITYSLTKTEKDNDTILMKDVLENIDLEYLPNENGVKENIILKSVPNIPSYSFNIKSDKLKLKYFEEENEYWFVNNEGKKDYQILPPYMIDANGVTSYSVIYRHNSQDLNDIKQLSVVPDSDWLSSPDRAYPVKIDPTVVKGSAPISNWNLDEGYGTTAGDTSTNANTLTITNATWQVNDARSGNYVGAKHLRFDGSGDYLSRTYDADFDFGTGSFSITMWVRIPNAAAGTDVLLARYSGAGFKVYMDASQYLCFGIDDDASWGPDDSACTTTAYNDSKWHHIEVVKSTTSSITLYVDGQSKAANAATTADNTLNGTTPTLYIGIDSDGSSNSALVDIDNITVYNYARDTTQVKADSVSKPQTAVSFGNRTQFNLQNGLVGWWKMDEASDATRIDFSGNGNSLTESASDTITQASGKFNSSGDFERGDTEYLAIADGSKK